MASDDFKITYNRPPSKLFDAEETRKIVIEELTKASIKSTTEFHATLLPKTPFFQGTLRNSFMQRVFRRGLDVVGQVRTSNPYALPVEEGSRPHWPPVDPLQLWVKRKLRIADKKQAKAVAFLIARKISLIGSKGVFMVRDTFNDKKRAIETYYENALDNITKRIARL